MSPFIGEFAGTALLITMGCGVVANVLLTGSKGQNSGWIVITFGWGMAVFLGVYSSTSLGGSGHLNPAVTIALTATGQFDADMLPRFASGTPKSFNGKISGFGTGTSDSILAWVGNGEYIVNERKTRENRQLLDAINFGKDIPFPKFAKGGGALDTGMLAVSDPKMSSNKTGNTTVINWTITGDISRQTRREIQQMIPQIATGVNAHNVENNYRR